MQEINVCFSILLGIGTSLGAQVALSDLIDEECLEAFDSDSQFSIEHMSPRVLQCFRTKSSTYIWLASEKIGFVDAKSIEAGDLDSLRDLLFELRELTGAFEQLNLKFVEIRGNNPDQMLVFRQQINGISVDNRSMMTFRADGHVSELRSFVVDPNYVLPSPSILEAEAVVLAIQAIEREIGGQLEDPSVSDNPSYQTQLYYSQSANDDMHELYWRTSVDGHSMGYYYSYSAIVDATTGQTVIANNVQDF